MSEDIPETTEAAPAVEVTPTSPPVVEPAPVAPTVLGPEMGYTDLLDHEIMEKIKRDAEIVRHPLRPSSAGYCARRLAYELSESLGHAKYEKELMNPTTYRLLNFGHSVEFSALQNLRMLPGFQMRYKQQVVTCFKLEDMADGTKAPLIEGSTDVVLWSEKYKCVLDVKSQKDGWSSFHKTRWDEGLEKYNNMKSLVRIGESAWYADDVLALLKEINGDFLADNIYQLNLYACSEFLRERGIDHAVIYKYGKNDSRHYEIRFRPSMELYRQVESKFNNIFKMVHSREPEKVPKESFLGSARCAFCPFKKQCWNEDALKAWYRTLPRKEWPDHIDSLGEASAELRTMFAQWGSALKADHEKEILENQILRLLVENKVQKIKLDSGDIYEVKYYKSPREHFELKRSKL